MAVDMAAHRARCIGYYPPPRLLRALREHGVEYPWELSLGQFRELKSGLTIAEGGGEFDRIARALHAEGDIETAIKRYGQDLGSENPRLIRRLSALHSARTIKMYRAVGADDPNPIRPGDWVALERRYASQHGSGGYDDVGGSKMLVATAKVYDIAWAGTSADEWILAPGHCRKNISVHQYLVEFGLAMGKLIPDFNIAEYK